MKKLLKGLLTLGNIIGISLPSVLVISCNNTKESKEKIIHNLEIIDVKFRNSEQNIVIDKVTFKSKTNEINFKLIETKIQKEQKIAILKFEAYQENNQKLLLTFEKTIQIGLFETISFYSLIKNLKYEVSSNLTINKMTKIKPTNIADGDTFYLDELGFRFVGIDTPEKYNAKNSIQEKYGKIASLFSKKILEDADEIYVVPQRNFYSKDPHDFKDKYGRVLVIVIVKIKENFFNLNLELVRKGKAKMAYISLNKNNRYYTDNEEFFNQLQHAQNLAQKEKIGIWDTLVNINEIYP
ncbi:thermonuclease family protein [[Mycoplasma] anseris]|uniref:TNase-like domain-containing protein n=1 Tax=[Mycoplasma] anseris TaxID=92400 RepID=A0A2Z4NCK5_9BACT|nr:thermonuclease family protein [[Mycoplasma] anseris]AWX69294.1 hypothetical protein DP065_00790 [[Mycoplasma] anseris]